MTNLGLRVRFDVTIMIAPACISGLSPTTPSRSPACLGYPPSPLRVQCIVFMNQIKNINFLFHDDEYEPECRYADIVELTPGACRKLGSLFVGLFFQE